MVYLQPQLPTTVIVQSPQLHGVRPADRDRVRRPLVRGGDLVRGRSAAGQVTTDRGAHDGPLRPPAAGVDMKQKSAQVTAGEEVNFQHGERTQHAEGELTAPWRPTGELPGCRCRCWYPLQLTGCGPLLVRPGHQHRTVCAVVQQNKISDVLNSISISYCSNTVHLN